MRFKALRVFSILLLVGSIEARPSKLGRSGIAEGNREKSAIQGIVNDSSTWRPIESRSSSVVKTDSRTELKSLDQSLRTVATQLLNVTSPNELKNAIEKQKITTNQNIGPNVLPIPKNNGKINYGPSRIANNDKSGLESLEDGNSEIISLGSVGVGFSRPVNSKFSYFESSHPGVAMAMTEEELERELMGSTSAKLITAPKNHATTTGGISTWILLNSPTTTGKSVVDDENSADEVINVKGQLHNKATTPVEKFETMVKGEDKTASTLEKAASPQSTTPMERITTLTKATTQSFKKLVTFATTTTEKPQKLSQTSLKVEQTKITSTPKISTMTQSSVRTTAIAEPTTTPKTVPTTKKPLGTTRSTLRPKITTPRAINVTSKPMSTKLSRPSTQPTSPKTSPTRKSSIKYPVEMAKNPSTSKIEKVTFRPVPVITTPKSTDNRLDVERPIFLAKVKTSFTADTISIPAQTSMENRTIVTKNEDDSDLKNPVTSSGSSKMKKPGKINNVLKVQLKRPTESPPNIEIQPIKVNAPILRIEKIETEEKASSKRNSTKSVPALIPNDSRIDVKFDFNPEATKVEVETTTHGDSIVTTTKRPNKRKKNKLRKRRPTTIAPSMLMTPETPSATTVTATSTENVDTLTELGIIDNTIQESKIAPESKVTTGSGNNTKNKKKQVQKPIGTQIYNFLSREVIPSFGVMSLVGLGLGLASYFLYPFGGTIARRNYVAEPSYKYNMDEYGGIYGQNEEEVFSKVLQGMTHQDGKYGGIKDYETNFYRYQQPYGHSYPDVKHTTRRVPDTSKFSTSSSSAYRPVQTTVYDHEKYRNTEFKYPELSSTPNYYDRPKKNDFVAKKSGDRQFVVGNVPKEYNYDNKANLPSELPVTTENLRTNFHQQENHKFSADSMDTESSYGHAEALKSHDDYEDIEITPSAVQVEHGPRSLKLSSMKLRRKRRESVIQLIPTRTEIEKEEKEIEKEEPLSNEILDIIDSVIPGQVNYAKIKKYSEMGENEKKYMPEKSVSSSTDIADNVTKFAIGVTSDSGLTEQTTPIPKKEADNTKKTSESSEKNIETTEPAEKSTTGLPESKTTSAKSVDSSTIVIETTSTDNTLTIEEILGTTKNTDEINPEDSGVESNENTTKKPNVESFNMFTFVKRIAEVKLRLGVAILKHASEGFARYLGQVQKRINGEE